MSQKNYIIFLLLLWVIAVLSFSEETENSDDNVTSFSLNLQKDKEILEKEPVAGSPLIFDSGEMEIDSSDGDVLIKTTELLDYDDESQIIYARGRTSVQFKGVFLEADKLIYNMRLNEVQAEGNVVLMYKQEKIYASSIIYDIQRNEGVAYGVYGKTGYVYFESPEVLKKFKDIYEKGYSEEKLWEHKPSLRQVNEDQAMMNNVSLTSCDFPIPHYRISGKEAVVYYNDRIFVRNAVVYIHEIPVGYVPFYTRSLKDRSPWELSVGYSNKLGGFTRFGYTYKHYLKEPYYKKEKKKEKISEYSITPTIDYYSRRGVGGSLTGRYNILFGRHIGNVFLFGVDDQKRDVKGKNEEFRWIIKNQLYSELYKDIYFQADIDMFSDAEIYMDFIDKFNDEKYGRRPERYVKSAAVLNKDYFISRIMVSLNERISRNRLTNYSDSTDNDRDYNVRFDTNDWGDEGLPSKRFGIVSVKAPHYQLNSSKFPLIEKYHLYYNYYFDAFNNLDKGLNSDLAKDDSWVRGVDLYQTLTHLIRFSEKLTWINAIGVGASYFDRQDDSWDYEYPDTRNDNGTPNDSSDDYWEIDNVKFSDKDEIIVGKRRVNLKDYNKEYLYADYASRLNIRLTESLRAFLKYTYRDGTDDSLGEVYESLGSTYTRNDLYNFRLKKNWIEAMIRYNLYYPDLSFSLSGGHNLQSEDDIYANEPINYLKSQINYSTQDKTLTFSPSVNYTTTQMGDPTDSESYKQKTIQLGTSLGYSPLSKLWWASVGTYWYKVLNKESDDNDNEHFDENESKWLVDGKIGCKLGPKYTVELGGRYDSREEEITRANVSISRDLHDLIVRLLLGYKKDTYKDDKEYEVKIAFEPKMPGQKDKKLKQEFSLITIEDESKSDKAAYQD